MKDYKIYKDMYLHLFNTVTTVLEEFDDNPSAAKLLLKAGQMDCENMYILAKNNIKIKKSLFLAGGWYTKRPR